MSKQVHQNVISFMELLQQANAVEVDSPILTSWGTSTPTGEDDNEVVNFSWEDLEDGSFSCKLTEKGIAEGSWHDESFFCQDSEGEDVQITLYTFKPLIPS